MNYMFSTERFIPGLPAEGHVVRRAECMQRNDAVFFELDRSLTKSGPTLFLLVPKVVGHSFYDEAKAVFAYILDATHLVVAEPIDLSKMTHKVLDWGGLAKDYDTAIQWQASKEDHLASQRDLKKFTKRR